MFLQSLQRLMHNNFYKYFLQNNLSYEKTIGFQVSNSAVIHLISQMLDAFNESKYTISIFIDLSKAFDAVDHDILLKKIRYLWYQRKKKL